jgi:AcrR family transcriptional regulator
MKQDTKALTGNIKRQTRAIRILDAAAELVLRWGYGKTTIDDIARHAGVGKGTIYLHWKTREALFEALLLHEITAVIETLIQRMQEQPEYILLHHVVGSLFPLTEQRPLTKALFTDNRELLGELARHSAKDITMRTQRLLTARDYLEVLRKHGFVRSDMSQDAQLYALYATISGFFLIDPPLTSQEQLINVNRAEILAQTVRNAFEPETLPSFTILQEIAPQLINLFTQLCQTFQQHMQEELG